ncbi:hypothetical protein, partial [Pseudomonas sp. H2]|uniref:hypothetical protein n=2 Tax=Pseudomonas sp. H2 TaxID=658612 RepID=UPI00126A20B6
MINNSKEALLARLEEGDVMHGWGAIMALGREPLEQLLMLRYLEGLSQSNFLEHITGSYFTDGQRNDQAVFEGLVLGPPQLSFAGVSGAGNRLTVIMPFISGEYASYSRFVAQPPRLKSSHGLREEMGYHVQMSVALLTVDDPAANQARLVLDLSQAEEFVTNLGESETARRAMGRFIQAELAKHEVFNHQFVLLTCELSGQDALAVRGLNVRTQAAPEGTGREGDGAAIVQLDLRGRRFGGTWPGPGVFPYLLPDGSQGVTLLTEQLRVPLLGELAERLLRHLSLPKAWRFAMKEEHTPHDRVVFGSIEASSATRQVEPMQARLGREQTTDFKVQGQAVAQWTARNISHPRSTGQINAQGQYQASDVAHFARESQVILVSAQLGEEEPGSVNAALVVESIDSLVVTPRVAVWRSRERAIEFNVAGHAGLTWEPTLYGELTLQSDGSLSYVPREPERSPAVLLERIRLTDGIRGDTAEVTVVILAYPAVLNVLPFHVPKVPHGSSVPFEVQNDEADAWLLFGEGHIDPASGVYTPPVSPSTSVAVVMANIRDRDAGYAIIELMREDAQVSMISERYKKVLIFTVTPVPINGTVAYANGLQQIALDIVIQTEDFRNSDGDVVKDPVSDLELSTLKVLAENGNPIEYVLEGVEGLDPAQGLRWGWSKSRNRYDYYQGARQVTAKPMADEGKVSLRVYVQSTEAEIRKFHAEFKGYDNRTQNSRTISKDAGEVELTGRPTPFWALNNYEFKPRRVASEGGKIVRQDTFNFYKYTTDYWELSGATQEYGNLRFYQVSFDHASIVRWESEQLAETFCSYVGYAFRPVLPPGSPGVPLGVSYESALELLMLERAVNYHGKLDYNLKPGEDLAQGTLLLTLDRVWDMPYWYDGMAPGGDYRSSLEGVMRFTLIDHQGNRHQLNVNFLPEGQPDSRNQLELRMGSAKAAAIDSAVHSNAFNFMSFIENGVDPRTGQYSLGIQLPELIGNNLCGPRLPLRLNFSPMNDQDSGFGIGWALNLSQFEIRASMLSLGSGERFKVSDNGPGVEPLIAERKLESFHFHNESEPDQQ